MNKYRELLIEKWKKRNRKQITCIGVVAAILILGGTGGVYLKKEIGVYKEQQKIEEETAEQMRIEEERCQKIEEALERSSYGEELRGLYEKYPQMDAMLLHLEDYEDWLIAYLLENPEAMEWVIAYPEYEKKTEEELCAVALEPIDLEKYEVRNGIPLFQQWDPAWGYVEYGDNKFAITGCAPTCLSMVAVGLTGDTSITPKKVADLSLEINAYVENTGTSWDLMDTGAKKLGLTSKEIDTWSAKAIRSELEAGNVLICSMGEGDFTKRGHFIVLTGITEEGKILLNDPNSRMHSEMEWDASVLLEQMKGIWVFYR